MKKRTLFIRSAFALFKNLVSLSFLFFSIVPMGNDLQVTRHSTGYMRSRCRVGDEQTLDLFSYGRHQSINNTSDTG